MTRPRIAWVIPTMRVGGSEIQLLHLMKGLEQEFEMTLICTRSEGALIGDARRAGAYVRVLDAPSGWDFRVERRLLNIFQAHPPHIMHTYLSGFDLFANRAARKVGIPIVISSRRELANWQKKRHLYLQRRANKYTDCIVANSEAVARYSTQREHLAESECRVIRNGVNADQYVSTISRGQIVSRFKLPTGKYVVGMVANFSPVKDHRLFVEMAERILERREDVHFLLVGTGTLVDSIRERLFRRRIEQHFTRVGTVGEVADLLHVMDVAVLTSKMEGFPNAIMEAMSARTPCVAANVGGIPELIEHGKTGILLENRSADEYANAVCSLLDDPDRRKALGDAAGIWIRENLRRDAMVASYRTLYHDLLRQKIERGD
jgi:glycosyltransferase involved in cell wall biosynthesis